jgi:hypothetical protein
MGRIEFACLGEEPFICSTELLLRLLSLGFPRKAEDFIPSPQSRSARSDFEYSTSDTVTKDLRVFHEQSAIILVQIEGCRGSPLDANANLLSHRTNCGNLYDLKRRFLSYCRNGRVRRHGESMAKSGFWLENKDWEERTDSSV